MKKLRVQNTLTHIFILDTTSTSPSYSSSIHRKGHLEIGSYLRDLGGYQWINMRRIWKATLGRGNGYLFVIFISQTTMGWMMVGSMMPGFMMVAQFCMTHAFFGYPTALGTPGLSRASSTGGESRTRLLDSFTLNAGWNHLNYGSGDNAKLRLKLRPLHIEDWSEEMISTVLLDCNRGSFLWNCGFCSNRILLYFPMSVS